MNTDQDSNSVVEAGSSDISITKHPIIKIHGIFPFASSSSPSPQPSYSGYCAKLETYMRFAAIPYTTVDSLPNFAPKGKVPYITVISGGGGGTGDVDTKTNTTTIADSHLAIRWLVDHGYRDLDKVSGLTETELGEGRSWKWYWERVVYPVTVRERWCVGENVGVVCQEVCSLSIFYSFRSFSY